MQLLGNTKYKVILEESYKAEKFLEGRRNKEQYAIIPGKYGHIYKYSANQLAIYVDSAIKKNRLPKEWKVLQHGDWEKTALIPDSDLDRACAFIKARTQRHYSAETLGRLKERGKNLGRKRKQQG